MNPNIPMPGKTDSPKKGIPIMEARKQGNNGILALLAVAILLAGVFAACATDVAREGGNIRVSAEDNAHTIFHNISKEHLQKAALRALKNLGLPVTDMVDSGRNVELNSEKQIDGLDYMIIITIEEIAQEIYNMTVAVQEDTILISKKHPETAVQIAQETGRIVEKCHGPKFTQNDPDCH